MLLQKVLIGVDFSEPSCAAVRWTASYFAPEAELMLVHSIEVPAELGFFGKSLPPRDELVAKAREHAERRLTELRDGLPADRVRTETRVGQPSEQIAAAADEFGADLAVVGEHGHHRGVLGGLGSTAEHLLHRSTVPVLIARGLPERAPRAILVAVDDSDLTPNLLEWARLLSQQFEAQVVGVHVLSHVLYAHVRLVSSRTKAESVKEKAVKEARKWLEALLESSGFATGSVSVDVPYGHPSHEILGAAQRHGADLIVLGSRGEGPIGLTLIGSVARSVVKAGCCPVLVAKVGGLSKSP